MSKKKQIQKNMVDGAVYAHKNMTYQLKGGRFCNQNDDIITDREYNCMFCVSGNIPAVTTPNCRSVIIPIGGYSKIKPCEMARLMCDGKILEIEDKLGGCYFDSVLEEFLHSEGNHCSTFNFWGHKCRVKHEKVKKWQYILQSRTSSYTKLTNQRYENLKEVKEDFKNSARWTVLRKVEESGKIM